MVGWVGIDGARPNATHYALAELERAGKVDLLITQNVDRLHQKAGSQRVVDLHGRLDQVVCLNCGEQESRQSFQTRLLQANPFVTDYQHIARPDGDADVPDTYVEKTTIPQCKQCSGVVMPDVVFFGGTVPKSRFDACAESLSRAGGLLVVGSSLQVYSGFRFCRIAEKLRIPIIIVNEGETRADDMATLKVEQSAMNRLVAAVDQIIPSQESKSA
jgi:NAD-dependent SIR2 family protein deacetylase